MKPRVLAFVVLLTNTLAGCHQIQDAEEGPSAEAESALIGENALTTNAIDLNGLFSNAIDLNGLDPQTLNPAALSALANAGLLGDNSRLIYKYLISCALDSSESLSFSWTDSSSVVHQEQYWGDMGLAPSWKSAAINKPTRRTVSACLGARANFYGTPVTISIRGPQSTIKNVSTGEQTAFPMEEGVFWGDLFESSPQIYACHNSTNVTNSRAKLRECAAGHVNDAGPNSECPYIAIVGDCDTSCAPPTSNDPYRPHCDDGIGGTTNDVITVFLPQ